MEKHLEVETSLQLGPTVTPCVAGSLWTRVCGNSGERVGPAFVAVLVRPLVRAR